MAFWDMTKPYPWADVKAEREYLRLAGIAADFWERDQRNHEYERGQAELIRDAVEWSSGWPPEQTEIVDHILTMVWQRAGYTDAGDCVWCKLPLHDDGAVLVDSTGGDACGVTTDLGAEHQHCTGFAPDKWAANADEGSDSSEVCSTCFVPRGEHGHP